eukprot:6208278-Pleurochrysis_carterae.AAC.1
MLQHEGQDANCDALLGTHRSSWLAATPEFEEEMQHLERYVSAFRATHGRAPVMYDMFCGEGTMGRGAILAGADVIGFDIARRPSTYGLKAVSRIGRLSNDSRKAICRLSLRDDPSLLTLTRGKYHTLYGPRGDLPLGPRRGGLDYVLERASFRARKLAHSPQYTDKAKPLKKPRILRTEQELRQRSGRRQIRDTAQISSSGEAAINNVAEIVAIGSHDGQ